jgi:hypothetical protein
VLNSSKVGFLRWLQGPNVAKVAARIAAVGKVVICDQRSHKQCGDFAIIYRILTRKSAFFLTDIASFAPLL